ncbi:MAG: hypothetical protein AABW47_04645 [Nanoarchaeota archaeon]
MAKRLQFKKNSFGIKKISKRGLSAIVITVILIAVSIAAIGLVWSFASNMINKQVKNSEACFGNFDKVVLNKQYTCYNEWGSEEPYTYTLQFSLGIGDVSVDKVIVGVSSPAEIKSYPITNTAGTVPGLEGNDLNLPDKNAGKTYTTADTTDHIFTSKIDSIQIIPVINGVQCSVSDSVEQIADCAMMGGF